MNLASATRTADASDDALTAERLEQAFAHCQAELLGTLYYLVGNSEDARDALQESFIKCWRHRSELDGIKNLKAWIFQVALNTGRDMRGAAWKRKRLPLVDEGAMIASRESPPDAQAERQEQLGRLRQAVQDLRPEEQEVFLLRQNGQLTYEQIALAVNIPLGTVKTRMRLALGKLRLVLAAE